jgi:hypothetical protein
MIKNGIYSLTATVLDGADVEVGGVLILHNGKIHGGDSFIYYWGTYDAEGGKWKGEMISREHTPTTRPVEERVQQIVFRGNYNDAGAKATATAMVGQQTVRYDAKLSFLAAS